MQRGCGRRGPLCSLDSEAPPGSDEKLNMQQPGSCHHSHRGPGHRPAPASRGRRVRCAIRFQTPASGLPGFNILLWCPMTSFFKNQSQEPCSCSVLARRTAAGGCGAAAGRRVLGAGGGDLEQRWKETGKC